MKRAGASAWAVLFAWLAGSVVRAQTAAPDGKTIDQLVQTQVDSGFSGVVLVALGDSVIWRRAYGRRGPHLSPASGFWIASMTKGFTAAAVLKLVEQHRLSLDDTLGGLFPDVPSPTRRITIHQLLTHTAGLGGSYTGGGIWARSELVRAILTQPLAYAPGSGYRYGDDDYELLAAIVEVVSHQRWEDFLQTTLLTPLGLTHTGFWCRLARERPTPVPGVDGTSSRCQPGQRGTRVDDWGHRGANGMSSTVDDLFGWSRALTTSELFSAESRTALASPQVQVRREGADDISSGYGARIYSRGARVTEVMRSGSGDDGHTGIVRVLPSGVTVIVLSNAGRHGEATWASYVAQLLATRG